MNKNEYFMLIKDILYMLINKVLKVVNVSIFLILIATVNVTAQDSTNTVFLTEEEKAWIAENPTILAANFSGYVPFNFTLNQKPAGFSVEYLNLTAQKVGLVVEYDSSRSWPEAIELIKQKKIDVFHSISQDDVRNRFLNFTEPYLESSIVIYGHEGAKEIKVVDDLRGKTIGVVGGSVYSNYYKVNHPELEIVEYTSAQEVLAALSKREIDLLTSSLFTQQYYIAQHFITGVENLGGGEVLSGFEVEYLRLATRKDLPILVTILEKGMSAISEEELQIIKDRWQTLDSEEISKSIGLTEEERVWLSQNRVIKVGVDPTAAPHEIIDENGKISGISGNYLDIIAEKLNIEFEWAGSNNWEEALSMMQAGEVDILSSVATNPARREYLLFTDIYSISPNVIFSIRGGQVFGNIDSLSGYKIAQIKDYSINEFLRTNYPAIEIIEVSTAEEAIKKISSGEVDAYIGDIPTGVAAITSEESTNIIVSGNANSYIGGNAMATRMDIPLLASAMQKALKSITTVQRDEITRRWLFAKVVAAPDYRLFRLLGIIALIIIAAVSISAIIIFKWNNSLRREVNKRKISEERLHISQQRLLLHREQSPVGIIEWDPNFKFLDWNPAAEKIFGFTKKEVLGAHPTERIIPASIRAVVDKVWEELVTTKLGNYSLNENITKDGRTITCEWHNTPLVDDEGNVIGVTAFVDDVTERLQKEANERQTVKMDAIGQLTGGIAHDFNNMLTVILGFSYILKNDMSEQEVELIEYCDEIIKAGERAKKLTSNLLEFSRKAPSYAETTSVNDLLYGMRHLLERTLTPRIKLIYELEEGIWPVWLDKARLEDSILNMSINAMHAMPEGGKLTINTCASHLTKAKSEKLDIAMGDYVLLSITDTGSGMEPDVLQKIFDPFFTTKGTEGTGLGLSQVYGFVQQAGGDVKASSEVGHGTTLTLYIPGHLEDEIPKLVENIEVARELSSGQETILVVDDEKAILKLNEVILTGSGYSVLTAISAEQAFKMLEENSVDLMLCDVIMQDVDGYQLAARAEKLYPDLKIQMMSGYIDENNESLANNKLHKERLYKPISKDTLLDRIIEILDENI